MCSDWAAQAWGQEVFFLQDQATFSSALLTWGTLSTTFGGEGWREV